eukprot:2391677-Pleurochrysis_carterae.AAC.1
MTAKLVLKLAGKCQTKQLTPHCGAAHMPNQDLPGYAAPQHRTPLAARASRSAVGVHCVHLTKMGVQKSQDCLVKLVERTKRAAKMVALIFSHPHGSLIAHFRRSPRLCAMAC